jgi:uncharacterized repeat protein (TIGR01451 family)
MDGLDRGARSSSSAAPKKGKEGGRMIRSMGLSRRRRNMTVALAALAGGLIFLVAGALADAGNPILGTIKGSAVDNGDGTVTIYVRGQWNWLTHGSNCNTDRNGAGVGIIWNDPTEPGYLVSNGPALSARVGVSALRAGDAANQIDQMVHPSDRGNQVEGYTANGIDYPNGQQFVDPSPPGLTAAQLAAWRSGCGRIPTAATASKNAPGGGPNGEATGLSCANGTITCGGNPWGSWGYEKTTVIPGKGTFIGYKHTYEKIQSSGPNAGQSGLPTKVCVNFYDVHGNNAGFQSPNNSNEIDVDGDNGGNHDNSIQTNAFNVNDGANCISVVTPTLTTSATDAKIGDLISDTATLGAVPAKAGGTLTFRAYGPRPAGVNVPDCTGAAVFTSSPAVAVNGPGNYNSGSFKPTAPGTYDWKVTYSGDPSNLVLPIESTCGDTSGANNEVSRVVDANIEITPANATNAIGTNHTLTAHVRVNDGSGYKDAPAGTAITFTIVSGPGGFVGPSNCSTLGATGSCTAVISSATPGTTTVRAGTDVTVRGFTLHRETGDANAGDSANATKAWATARIEIAPSATNEIGKPHTFTVTLSKDTGTGAFVAAPGEHVTVALADTNGATHSTPTGTCTNNGANTDANGQCTITFTSNAAGKVTAHASSTLNINGAVVAVQTNGTAQNSADAVKTFVDAKIQLTPPSAINPVSTNHVLTARVEVNAGSGSFGPAPDGTKISFTIDSGPGSLTTANPCTTSGGTGSCTVTLTSATPGTTVVSAHVTLSVGGVPLTRNTDATASNSGPATKLFADDTVRTDILDAANNVVTSVVAGTIVHDKVFVAKSATTPASVPDPTGNVVFHRYTTNDCTGTPTNQTVVLTPGSPSTAVSDAFATVSSMSYSADYAGDVNYPARTGACEPLTVTPLPAPAIAIVKNPKSQTVARGGTATFTITVTNVGNTVLTDVNVVDPLSPNCNRTKAQIPALASMAPGASISYTCTRPSVTTAFDNVATATGTPPTGPNVTASDTAPVKVQALTPAKKVVTKKKKPKVVSHKKPKATG